MIFGANSSITDVEAIAKLGRWQHGAAWPHPIKYGSTCNKVKQCFVPWIIGWHFTLCVKQFWYMPGHDFWVLRQNQLRTTNLVYTSKQNTNFPTRVIFKWSRFILRLYKQHIQYLPKLKSYMLPLERVRSGVIHTSRLISLPSAASLHFPNPNEVIWAAAFQQLHFQADRRAHYNWWL